MPRWWRAQATCSGSFFRRPWGHPTSQRRHLSQRPAAAQAAGSKGHTGGGDGLQGRPAGQHAPRLPASKQASKRDGARHAKLFCRSAAWQRAAYAPTRHPPWVRILLLSVVLAMFSRSSRNLAASALLSRAISSSRARDASAASRKPASQGVKGGGGVGGGGGARSSALRRAAPGAHTSVQGRQGLCLAPWAAWSRHARLQT